MKRLLSCIAAAVATGVLASHAATFTLAECAFHIDGATALLSRGNAVPIAADLSAFNPVTGLGAISIRITLPGPHYVGVLLDPEIDQTVNTFFNEFSPPPGSPAPGQSWEIDELGYQGGNLYTNFLSGRLDNSNGVPGEAADDVAMALAWNFTLATGQTGLVQMTLTESVPATGFYLAQTDPHSSRTLYFSSTLRKLSDDTEPPRITCPVAIAADADPGQCFRSNLTYTVTATDNRPGVVTVACVPPSGARFDVGRTPVLCTATDAGGNTSSCSFTVTIHGTGPLVMNCPNIIVECAPPGGQPVDFAISATGSSSNVTVNCLPPSGTSFLPGATEVYCTARDDAGNCADCSFAVFLVGTNCAGRYPLVPLTCLAGEVHADPLLYPYPCGTCVRVTGVAAAGWFFMGWLGDARGADESVWVTMTQRKCVEAVFGTPISVGTLTNGTAWLDPSVPLYPCGSQVRAYATPADGYYFDRWDNLFGADANPLDFQVAETNVVFTPVFRPLPPGEFALTIETRGGGEVLGESWFPLHCYPAGSNVVLWASADSGQTFEGWSFAANAGSPPALRTENPLMVMMETNIHLVAHFSGSPWIEIVRCQGELVEGMFRMKVHGKLLETYAIEATPHLKHPQPFPWREVARGTNQLGAVEFEDPYLPNASQRFYRARLVP